MESLSPPGIVRPGIPQNLPLKPVMSYILHFLGAAYTPIPDASLFPDKKNLSLGRTDALFSELIGISSEPIRDDPHFYLIRANKHLIRAPLSHDFRSVREDHSYQSSRGIELGPPEDLFEAVSRFVTHKLHY